MDFSLLSPDFRRLILLNCTYILEKKQKIQWRASGGDGAPKLQISVPCRGRTCPERKILQSWLRLSFLVCTFIYQEQCSLYSKPCLGPYIRGRTQGHERQPVIFLRESALPKCFVAGKRYKIYKVSDNLQNLRLSSVCPPPLDAQHFRTPGFTLLQQNEALTGPLVSTQKVSVQIKCLELSQRCVLCMQDAVHCPAVPPLLGYLLVSVLECADWVAVAAVSQAHVFYNCHQGTCPKVGDLIRFLGRGCDEALFSDKKGFFNAKGGGNSVN